MALDSKKISFTRDEGCDFITVLRKRVNQYFQEKGISPKANVFMHFKTAFLMGLVGICYSFLVSGLLNGWGALGAYMFLGFLVAVGGMNIAHDALHGSYASHSVWNRVLGLFMDLFGASSFYWRKEHTVDHHTFTNVKHHDADLEAPFLLRLCPESKHYSFHRFQNWYAPILYSMNLMRWVYFSDFKRVYKLIKYREQATVKPSLTEIILLFTFKVIHTGIFFVIPLLVLPYAWWVIFIGYVAFLATMGITLTVIFQLAHIVENVAFPLPNEDGKIANTFAKHQLTTTSNFARSNWLVSFLFGGLNFQIEHHIFPHICHTHLRKIAPIVQETAKEFGLPYYENPSFIAALRSHFRTLKRLGQPPLEN